jgi:Zn-dependent protease
VFKTADVLPANYFTQPLLLMARAGIEVNVVLMLLNLLPILPLDGGRIVASLLPSGLAWRYAKLEPLGFPILLLLIFTSTLGVILAPLIRFSFRVIGTVFQI